MNRYQRPAVQPASNIYGDPQRSQSLTNGAGQAALAALRMHSPSLQQQQQQQQPAAIRRTPQPRRANSLVTAPRSNSLRTYTYQPKGSYIPGQANINNNPNKTQHLAKRSAGSFSSRTSAYAKSPVLRHDGENEEESIIITTKTTKVVDSQGRTQSITTETIKTLPDGSNIIEKTTKNISRSNSRTNSLRNNSILSASNPGYNLTKIEEDLQDFDYSYQIDGPHDLEPNLKLHTGEPSLGPPIQEEFSSFNKNERAGSLLSENNLRRATSSDSSPSKPLKSILKHRLAEASEFRDAADLVADPETPTISSHPYKNFTTPDATHLQPKSKVPSIPSPTNQSQVKSNMLKQLGSPATARSPRNDDLGSFRSANSPPGSIKFSPEVETIPIYSHGKPSTPMQPKYKQLESEEKLKLSNQELYAKALLVAQERVYGNKILSPQANSAPIVESPVYDTIVEEQPKRTLSLVSNMSSLVENKTKRDKKLDDYNKVGVEDRYKYGNHHKDFAVHSFRNSDENPKPSSRKERAKEEKKLFKQQKLEAEKEKEHEKQLKKEEEKQRKEEEKLKKEETKKKRKSSGRGLFGRKKKDEVSAPLEVAGVTAAGAVVGAGAIVASTVGGASDPAHGKNSTVPQSSFAGPNDQQEPTHLQRPTVPQSSFSGPVHQQEPVYENQPKPEPVYTEKAVPAHMGVPVSEKETIPEQEPASREAFLSEDYVHNMPSPTIIPDSEVTLRETGQIVSDANKLPVVEESNLVAPATPPSHTFEPPQILSRKAPDSPSTSNFKEPIEKPVLNTVIPETEADARSGDYATDDDTDIDDTEDTNIVQGGSGVVRVAPDVNTKNFDLSGTPTPVQEDDNDIPERIHPVIEKEKLGGVITQVDYPGEAIVLGPDDVPVEAIEVGPVNSKYHDPSTTLPTIISGLDGSPIVLESGDKSSSFDETGTSYENKGVAILNKKLILSSKQDELNEIGLNGKSEVGKGPEVAKASERIDSGQPDVDNAPVIYSEHETQSYGGKYGEFLPAEGPKPKTPSDATASSADEPPEVDSHPSELEKKPSVLSKITGKKYNKFKHKLFKYFLNTYDK